VSLIKLSCNCYVAADEIAEITVNDRADAITVRMKNGIGHGVDADYGKGVYHTVDRLVAEVNAATRVPE
jgi:hypothetical protein